MNPLIVGLSALGCVALAGAGVRMLRSTPAGAEAYLADTREDRRSLLRSFRTWLGERYGRTVMGLLSGRKREQVQHRIDAAGRPGGMTLQSYAAQKASLTILLALVGVLLLAVTGNPLPILALAVLGWIAVDFRLGATAKRRQKQLNLDLPDFMDVLAVTVGAGLSFRNGLKRVADAIGGPLGEEVETTLRQMSIGSSRRAAFEGLRDRNDSETLALFITALLQAEELGAPLGPTLHSIAADMRKASGQNARRAAAKAAPRVSVIVTTVIVPGAIILILASLFVGASSEGGGFPGLGGG